LLNRSIEPPAQWISPDPTLGLMLKIVGKDLVSTEYARMNSVLKGGRRLAFGTDWPASGWVATYRPLDATQVALTRKILPQYGKQEVMPVMPPENERITLDQALKAHTLDVAYVLDLEDRMGSLQPGKLADIVVLERDLHKIKPSEISTTRVNLTMMNGQITYRAPYQATRLRKPSAGQRIRCDLDGVGRTRVSIKASLATPAPATAT
jgi:predicted amidohydrolase YtcJ